MQEKFFLINDIDQFNTTKLKEILQEHYWTTISKFGTKTDKQTWLLVQHAEHGPFFQSGCLFILSDLVNKGETSKSNYAYLYDCVLANFKKKQKNSINNQAK